MELYSINLNSPIEVEKELKFENITYDGESLKIIIKDNGHINLKVGQWVSLDRNIDRGNDNIILHNYGEIVNIEDNIIWVTQAIDDLIKIKNIEEVTSSKIRLQLEKNHNIFQQDIEFCKTQEIYFYDINRVLIMSANTNNFGIPKLYDNVKLSQKDCIIENKKLESCGLCEQGAVIYNYIFCPKNASLDSILLEDIDYKKLDVVKFVSFKHSPFYFITDDNNVNLYEDEWFEQIVTEDDNTCNTYINGKTSTTLNVYDAYYKIDLGLTVDSDYLSLGNDDSFNTYFVDSLKESLIPLTIDMERIKYVPAYLSGNQINNAEKISFYLHFRERAKIPDNERLTVNSIYTSGNVYYDTWHIDSEKKDYTWWNGYETRNIMYKERFDVDVFTEFNKNHGRESDLIGYLNFTDNDIFYRKKKVGQSFLRLSFYTSTDPIEQKLLYYSTIFLDDGELYGKYLKQLQFLQNDKKYKINKKSNNSKVNNNAVVVMTSEGIRVDTKTSVTNEFDKNKCSEGFNLYLFAQDQDFDFENGKKTIYMRVDFNHAGNGKTTPLIMWPKDKKDGRFCPLTVDNYLDSLYIPVELQYIDNRYVYTFINGENNGDEIELILYEPKLDMIEEINDFETPNDVGVISVSPEVITYNKQSSSQNIIRVVSNRNWKIVDKNDVEFSIDTGASGITDIKIIKQPIHEINIIKLETIANDNNAAAEGYAEIEVRKSNNFKPYLRISNDIITMLYIQNEAKIYVNSNTAWSIDYENNNNTGITISAYTENDKNDSTIIGDGYVKIFKASGYLGDNFSFTIRTNNDSEFDGVIEREVHVSLSNDKPTPNNCTLVFENIPNFEYTEFLTLQISNQSYSLESILDNGGMMTDVSLEYNELISLENKQSGITCIVQVKDVYDTNKYIISGGEKTNICEYDFNFTSATTRYITITLQEVNYTIGRLFIGTSADTATFVGWNIGSDSANTLYDMTIFSKPETLLISNNNNEINKYYGLTIKNEELFNALMKISGTTLKFMLITQVLSNKASESSEILGSDVITNIQDEVILGAASYKDNEPLYIEKPVTGITCRGNTFDGCTFDGCAFDSCRFDGCAFDSCTIDVNCPSDGQDLPKTEDNYYYFSVNEDFIKELLQGINKELINPNS